MLFEISNDGEKYKDDDIEYDTANPEVTDALGLSDNIEVVAESQEGITICREVENPPYIISRSNRQKMHGEFLHILDKMEPDVTVVKKVIDAFPDALTYENEDGYIPIQSAAWDSDSERYVPFLAEEARKRKIGSERGGILLPYISDPDLNILQSFVCEMHDEDDYPHGHSDQCHSDQEGRFVTLKKLRGAGLLLDKDIVQFNLIGLASFCLKRIEYLISLYPKALSIPVPDGYLPINPTNYDAETKIDTFAILLKAGMEHYPQHFGFLFKRDLNGERAITQAIEEYGKDVTLQTIQNIIPPSEDHPILHHVFRYTPQLADDFIYRYPDAVDLKDRRGRHLIHVALKSGLKLSGFLLMMIRGNRDCIQEKDPTNLYPFMLAATKGKKKDLTTIYKLLLLRPELISR